MPNAPKPDDVIYWVHTLRPNGSKGRDAVAFKRRLTQNTDEGLRGDVQARPVALGPGPHTATYGWNDFEDEAGEPIKW